MRWSKGGSYSADAYSLLDAKAVDTIVDCLNEIQAGGIGFRPNKKQRALRPKQPDLSESIPVLVSPKDWGRRQVW